MKEIDETDWMIMGMIHAYKIIQKTKDEFSGDSSLNDIDFQYLVEMQKRNVENPEHLSEEYPYKFLVLNSSAHDNVHVGMMNVFFLLDEQKEKQRDLDGINTDFLIKNLVTELIDDSLYENYDSYFQERMENGNDDDLEDLK